MHCCLCFIEDLSEKTKVLYGGMKNCCSVFANVKKTVYLSSEVIKLSVKRLDKFCIIVD